MSRFSGFDDAYNIIEGLRHGGAAQNIRRSLTDFGSGWNALRGLTRASETFAEMTASKGFKQALSSAKEVRSLGKGHSGEAKEMVSTFRGQELRFARKTGEIGQYEVAAMRKAQETVAPDVYAAGKGRLDMELFSGQTLQAVDPSQLEGIQGRVGKAFSKVHAAGFEHADPHLGNIMLTREGNIGIIDYGSAKRLAGPRAAISAQEDIDFASKLMKARIEGTSQLAAVDPFASAWSASPGFSGFDDSYNIIEGLPHGGMGQDMRRQLTEFGSGWRGLFAAGAAATTGYFMYAGATRVKKHELLGMSYLGKTEEELYEMLTTPQSANPMWGDLLEEREPETAATVGTSFHEYAEAMKMAKGKDVKQIEKYIYSEKHGLAGYADVIYEDDTVSDIKSVGAKVFAQVKARGAPLQKSFDQVNTYAILNGSRMGKIEYHLRSDPSQKVVYEWEANEENFKQNMAKVNRVRQRINLEVVTGKLDPERLPTKLGISAQRVNDLFTTNKYSFDVEGVKEALGSFINKREQLYHDKEVSTFNQLQNVNISNMMDGNRTEYMFQAAKNGGRRHQSMGYS